MYKLLKKLITKLESFEQLNDEEQINKLKKLKKLFPKLTILIQNKELKQ